MSKLPRRRKDGLVVQELADEILIYDQVRDKAHCLNRSAALIWLHCDGEKSIDDIGKCVGKQLESKLDDRAVWFALSQFGKDHLLEESLPIPPEMMQGMNRRQMVRALGLAAVVAIPLVTSIVAPTPAQAATCLASGASCTTSAQCCSGLCEGTCA